MRRGMPVQQPRRLVARVPHQPPVIGGNPSSRGALSPWTAARSPSRGDNRREGSPIGRSRTTSRRRTPVSSATRTAAGRRRRTNSVPSAPNAPPIRAAGPDRRRRSRGGARPACRRRPTAPPTPARAANRPRGGRRWLDRGAPAGLRSWPPSSPYGSQRRVSPGRRVRGSWVRYAVRSRQALDGAGLHEPSRHHQVIARIAIRAGWSHGPRGSRQRPPLVRSFDASAHRALSPCCCSPRSRPCRHPPVPRGRPPTGSRTCPGDRPAARARRPCTARRPCVTTAPRRRPRARAPTRPAPRPTQERLGTRTPTTVGLDADLMGPNPSRAPAIPPARRDRRGWWPPLTCGSASTTAPAPQLLAPLRLRSMSPQLAGLTETDPKVFYDAYDDMFVLTFLVYDSSQGYIEVVIDPVGDGRGHGHVVPHTHGRGPGAQRHARVRRLSEHRVQRQPRRRHHEQLTGSTTGRSATRR